MITGRRAAAPPRFRMWTPGDVHLHYLHEGEAGMITLNRTMEETKKDGRRDDRLRLGRGTRGLTVPMNRFYLRPSCLRMSSQSEFLISECLGIGASFRFFDSNKGHDSHRAA